MTVVVLATLLEVASSFIFMHLSFRFHDFLQVNTGCCESGGGEVRRGTEDSSCFPDTMYHNTILNLSLLKQMWKKKKKSQRGGLCSKTVRKKALLREELQAQMRFPFILVVQISTKGEIPLEQLQHRI